MPKKKPPTSSGFGLFMVELQEERARKGQRIPLAEMKDFADPLWKAMSQEQKKMYNERAKRTRRVNPADKLASDGTPIRQHDAKIEEEANEKRQMISNIREFVHLNEEIDVFKAWTLRQSYYIMSFNILCYTEEGEFYPLEVGIVEYSIRRGIVRRFHKFIHPGSVPLGYAGEAKRHSEETHNIPFTGHKEGSKDYRGIMREIEAFLCPRGTEEEWPPIFAVNESIEQTHGCLLWLARRSGYVHRGASDDGDFRVWDLCCLLLDLRTGVGQPLPSYLIAEDILKKTMFDYTPNTRCDFHEELDCKDCALGYVTRLCFLLSDTLCGAFSVEVTDKHLPSRSQAEKHYEVHNPVSIITQNPMKVEPKKTSSSSGLYGLEEDSDDDISLDYNPRQKPINIHLPTSALASLNLSSKPSTNCANVGLGRGRPPKN